MSTKVPSKFKSDYSKNVQKNENDEFGFIEETASDRRLQQSLENDRVDEKYGFHRYRGSEEKIGWLLNIHPTEILDEDRRLISAVDYYFLQEDGSRFKISLPYKPYFYVMTTKESLQDVTSFLLKKFAGYIASVDVMQKEDLDLVRQPILAAVRRNREAAKSKSCYSDMFADQLLGDSFDTVKKNQDHLDSIVDIREYDVLYHIRVSIDKNIFVGHWYSVWGSGTAGPSVEKRNDVIVWPDCIVLAYDIETTKLPLKFPDASTDQVMMISYMIDGQGYLITNREIVNSDVEDFEYTPKPEFEGPFVVFNEENEMCLLQRFFDHILEVKPHVFVTYNGDFFDWPFLETRAGFHGLDMLKEIGFSRSSSGSYLCRSSVHMDCLCWVKRDSYLPVGSQNLKAVAKAKLHYDPVELDPEDMCSLAAEQPQVLANYSVSDAVATYYLYMKYVHPFIFALCTIIPLEPDEVLRKGSGTLCETLLMVQAYDYNIVYPNKQETILNKMTEDGHVLDQETYVGGHVEAIESGVFRTDIPCRFRMVPEAFQKLIDSCENTVKFCIEVEEGIPMDQITNFKDVIMDIKSKLEDLRDTPCRLENPLIYHLDVSAMYPNIILTNRLQPSAMVDVAVCAACDFNKPGNTCQRKMAWMWRGEVIPATRSEFQRIQQQLETERFPPLFPGGLQRAFHELSKEDRAAAEKKRLQEYCRKAYKKTHVTQTEERWQIVCQRENNFYVSTVRSFRDRRYEYKGLAKGAKKELAEAQKRSDPANIKEANACAILYDSLQLAHKCILNSFYGYVMRKGSRWHSMEMAGIVCNTGATIITRAREIIEQVGRPLELDTDGIWCILPASFPENYIIKTMNSKKREITISYPGAILNVMVKEHYTNDQYHVLEDSQTLKYSIRSENSIFFEVDGPYRAMVLPASKEEGKKLKKRYAVFNFDGTLAELKGFEVKRRGELQLIKIFQSSVFDAFLKGDTLEACYSEVAKIADYWLDVLFSKAANMPDSELFDLISENRSMSKKLEDYSGQKSTSISTAKRLAEFLGDQMVKDAGLSCKFIISKKPEGAMVTERAIPLAIFQSEPSVKHHYLRRWLKDPSIVDFDIRNILDWDYYIERFSGTVQKIITIPAALQGVPNPVPRISHPNWLHKRVLERNDTFKQRRIIDMFKIVSKKDAQHSFTEINADQDLFASQENQDIEDSSGSGLKDKKNAVVYHKRKRSGGGDGEFKEECLNKSWREVLGNPPSIGETKESIQEWLKFQKKKWKFQQTQRLFQVKRLRRSDYLEPKGQELDGKVVTTGPFNTLDGFLRRAHRTLMDVPWQIIQLAETNSPGLFRLWALVGNDLHLIKLVVPRIFYVNQLTPKAESETNVVWRKISKILPRSGIVHHLYEYTIPEELFQQHSNELTADLATPDIEGIYETQVPLQFRALVQLGCICVVDRTVARIETDTFDLNQLKFKTVAQYKYLESDALKHIFFYHHRGGTKSLFGIFIPMFKKGHIFVLDTVRSNQMPNLNALYNAERQYYIDKQSENSQVYEANYNFSVKFETDDQLIYKHIQKAFQSYKDERRGPTLIAVQSVFNFSTLVNFIPILTDFPVVTVHSTDIDNLYNVLDWQRTGAKTMIRHYLGLSKVLENSFELSRYLHVPVGNLPKDTTSFGADLFYARHLQKHNCLFWCSPTRRPDLGGHEFDDNRLVAELEEISSSGVAEINHSGCYTGVSVELELEALAVTALLQAPHINELEGTSSSVAFDAVPQTSVQDMIGGNESSLTLYDESARCASAFRILRQMVSSWLRDISLYQNIYADFQVIHFYRWLRDPTSLLYDPALHRMLYTLMQKLFFHLVSEFMHLGSTVVYANFNKIIICTKKRSIKDAVSYVKYIVGSIHNKEVYHSLNIQFSKTWELLFWLDPANSGGVCGEFPDNLIENGNLNESASQESEFRDSQVTLDMNWNLADYLPTWNGCQNSFKAAIASYINAIYEKLQEEGSKFTPGNTPVQPRLGSSNANCSSALKDYIEFAQDLICGDLAQKMYLITQKLYKLGSAPYSEDKNEDAMKKVFCSYNKKTIPGLEFVTSVCKVLSLDHNVSEQVQKLKRDCLKILNISEFAAEAVWKDPCSSYILPEVICRACNHCRNIDLCKDLHQEVKNGIRKWLCANCGTGYENYEIQHRLLSILQNWSMAYVLQDLQCDRCTEIKQRNLARFCSCGGRYKTLLKREDFNLKYLIFHSIAIFYDMPILKETTAWVLDNNPWMKK